MSLKKNLQVFAFTIFLFLIIFFKIPHKLVYAAITDLPPYGTNVETWWSTFWANPLSSTYIPLGQIPSPANTVTVSPGVDLQAIVDSLPSTGGTILLNPGEYAGDIKIYGRNNIHIRGLGSSPTNVVLTGAIFVAGCKEASYGFRSDGYDYFVGGIFRNTQYNIDCVTKNRASNIYFYNFTMDAKGRLDPAQNWIELANGVVFDKIIWQGLTNDPTKVHWGHANGHVMEDNIWFRGNVFKGTYQTAVYLDGCHSCGIISSTIEANFYNSGLIFMDNNDLDYDYNKNGIFDPNELRNGRYLVNAYNTFAPSSNPTTITTYDWFSTAILYEGSNVLTLSNNVTANVNIFSFVKGACSYHSTSIIDFYDLVYKNNYLKVGGGDFFQIEYNTQYCGSPGGATYYRLGKYTVSNNTVLNAGSAYSFAKELTATIDGPNTVANNCKGATCPDPRIVLPTPTSMPASTPTRTPTLSPTIAATCNEDINEDNYIDLSDYGLLALNFFKSNPVNSRTDINRDGIVDLSDFGLLVKKFLKPC